MMDERRAAAAGSAWRLVVAAIGDDEGDALDVLAEDVDPRLVAVEAAVIAARTMVLAYGSETTAYDEAVWALAEARAPR